MKNQEPFQKVIGHYCNQLLAMDEKAYEYEDVGVVLGETPTDDAILGGRASPNTPHGSEHTHFGRTQISTSHKRRTKCTTT